MYQNGTIKSNPQNNHKEHLLSEFDFIEETTEIKKEFTIQEYDKQCEEYMQIDKILPLYEDRIKFILFIAINFITLFLINLFIIWFPKLKLKLIYTVGVLDQSTHLGVYGKDRQFYIVKIKEINLPLIDENSPIVEAVNLKTRGRTFRGGEFQKVKTFQYKLFNYYYSTVKHTFIPYKFDLNSHGSISNIDIEKKYLRGLTKQEVDYQTKLFGKCDLEIEVDSYFKLILKEITDPFYVFQIFSVILWLNNEYIKYAIVIIFSTLISLLISVIDTRKNLVSIKSMARYSCDVKIKRRDDSDEKREERLCDSSELVPGDIFELPEDNSIIPCDCLLMSGSVIMNESILTGESTPIIKQSISRTSTLYDDSDSKNILFSGTRIVQKRHTKFQRTLALVLKSGFNTEKGGLIRAILYPKENNFKIKEDSLSYIKIMTCLSITGFTVSLPFMIREGIPAVDIIFRALDLITTTVPPALPACIGIGISYALMRIKESNIICINRDRVNEAGKIDMICFDKTGTLTEDFLDVYGFRPVRYTQGKFCFGNFIKDCGDLVDQCYKYVKGKGINNVNTPNLNKFKEGNKSDEIKSLFIECIATCHSVTRVKNKLIGDPIDVKMFECSQWVLDETSGDSADSEESLISTFFRPPKEVSVKEKLKYDQDEENVIRSHYEVGIVRRFDFSSKLQRISVITKNVNEDYFKVFCKGSPEKIKELCKSNTIPENFNEILAKYTQKGFRVLALAFKIVKMNYIQAQSLSRERVESSLSMLGLVIVQNKLKTETADTIQLLKKAKMKMLMATGDNILTAVSVAKECHLIDPQAKIYQLDKQGMNLLGWNMLDNFGEAESDDETYGQNYKKRNYRKYTFEEDRLRVSKFSAEEIVDCGNTDVQTYESSNLFKKENEIAISAESHQEQSKYNIREKSSRDSISDIRIANDFYKLNLKNENIAIAVTGQIFDILCQFKSKYLNSSKSGKVKLYFDVYKFILQNATIFARMSPEHKTNLVDALKEEDYKVMMCGDGANDCGALRAANVGVSLSIEEASIAAPFTSTKADISCLKKILIEGKAALVTTIQCFKYMMLYSVIQFVSVTLMVIIGTYLSDNQFLMSDLFLIFPLAFLIAKTESADSLTSDKPVSNLKSFTIVSSIILQSLLQFSIQCLSYMLLKSQTWFAPLKINIDEVEPAYENTTIFLISYLQYLITAVAFSIGKPFKKDLSSNTPLVVFLILTFSHGLYLILFSDEFSNWLFNLVYLSDSVFKFSLASIAILNFIASVAIERYLIPRLSIYRN